MFRAFVVVLAVSAAACASERPPDWDYVYTAIIRPSCATAACHSSTVRQSGLDLSTRDVAYRTLVRRPCGSLAPPAPSAGGLNVDPGHPETSAVMYWLRGENNQTMPPDFPLPATEIDAIERWILDGATCD